MYVYDALFKEQCDVNGLIASPSVGEKWIPSRCLRPYSFTALLDNWR